MLDAHTDAGFAVGEPFGEVGLFDFGERRTLTKRVTSLGAVMMQHRLTPPPQVLAHVPTLLHIASAALNE